MADTESSSSSSTESKSQSGGFRMYQFRALVYKTLSLQSRQTRTNVCQLIIPLYVMGLLAFLNIASGFLSFGGVRPLQPAAMFDPRINATWNCYNETQGRTDLCGSWGYLFFSAPSTLPNVGSLSNDSSGSGFLGEIPQQPYTSAYIQATSPNPQLSVPFFAQYSSPDAIDDAIFQYLKQQTGNVTNDDNDDFQYDIPTGAVNFMQLSTAIGAGANPTLQYELQISSNTSGTAFFPPHSINDPGDRQSFYMSLLHSAFASSIFNSSIVINAVSIAFPYIPTIPPVGLLPMYAAFYIPTALSFVLPVYVYSIVLEKNSKILIMMKIMGLNPWEYRVATALMFYAYYLVIAVVVSIIGLASLTQLLWQTSWVLWILLFAIWGLTQIAFSFFFAALFSRTQPATISSYVFAMYIYAISFFVNLLVIPQIDISGIAYWLYLMVPHWAFMRAMWIMAAGLFDPLSEPLSISTLWHLGSPLMVTFYFLILQIPFYMGLAIYFENVMPQDYGVQQSWLYPITWLKAKIMACVASSPSLPTSVAGTPPASPESQPLISIQSNVHSSVVTSHDEEQDCRQERINAHDSSKDFFVRVVDMEKVYPGKGGSAAKRALDGLCLALREGECFGLLGPNGAGKTSLISILCGLTTPTSGVGYVGRHEIPRDVDVIYESMGYCPQHDILWDDLSVQEHIIFYCRLRNLSESREKSETDRLLRQVNLRASADKLVSELSGGMKRRLSLSISMVGSPKFVLLDEPTTGLDPVSRQAIWDLISEARHDRCILLTTHNMEEADTLCHRIGIMSQGRLRCIGTQLDLKHRFGLGYKLSVTTTHQETATEFVMSLFPAATLETVFSGTLTFQIETGFDLSTLFTAMKNKADYHITSWAVNQTSLEDVFLRIVRMEEDEAAAAAAAAAAE